MESIETVEQDNFTPEPEPDADGEVIASAPLADDAPAHKAVCMIDGCQAEVLYRLTASGAGFIVIELRGMDLDTALGMGPDGRPVCPIDGHGEMTLADETIPAADAFAQVAEKLTGAQRVALPGVFPAFNFEGAFKEIVEQAQRVEMLDREHDDAKKEAAEAKKSLDKASELLMRMTLEFERRRKEKPEPAATADPVNAAAPAPEPAARLESCRFEQEQAEQRCPFCRGDVSETVLTRLGFHAGAIPPADAAAHVEQAQAFYVALDIEAAVNDLDALDIYVDAATVGTWSAEDRAAVSAWANAEFERRHEVPDVIVPERPAVLGKPHVPAEAVPGERQVCTLCDVVLFSGTEDFPYYKPTDLIGVDCAGKPNADHHYPKKGKKAPAKKKAGKGRR
jgi:hypothetical protein